MLKPLRLVASLCLLAAASLGAQADTFPTKPIKVLVGYTPGGAVDAIARSVGKELSNTLGQPVIVENKPGAATNIAIKSLITSAPDGYTLLLSANALAVNTSLFQPPPYDIARDIVPVALVGRVPVVFAVAADSPLKSLAALIAAAKAQPGSVTFATPGNASTPHLAMEFFERTAGISLVHVPYKGGAQALTDVMGNQVQLVAINLLEALPLARGGKLRVLAVLSPQRSAVLPDVPTVAESGFPGFQASVWYGLVAPAATPPAIVAQLHAATEKALASPQVQQQLSAAGGEVLPGSAADLGALIESERVRYGKLIREGNIKAD
jgi:tripartite-type tricarboxylate transporter receptor subunit TctC